MLVAKVQENESQQVMVGWKGGVEELDAMESVGLGFFGQVLASQGTVLAWRPGQDVAGSLGVSSTCRNGQNFCSSMVPEVAASAPNGDGTFRSLPVELNHCREVASAFSPQENILAIFSGLAFFFF